MLTLVLLLLTAPNTPGAPSSATVPAAVTHTSIAAAGSTAAALLEVSFDEAGLQNGRAELFTIAVPPSASPIEAVSGTLGKKGLIAWPASSDGRTWRALAPIDVDTALTQLELTVHATLRGGRRATWKRPVPIVAATYEARELSVQGRYVRPSKRQRRRAAKEQRKLEKALSKPALERLWRGSFARPTAGEETSPFGTLRLFNKKKKSRHLGWDLDGSVGTPVTSAARGKVVLSANRFYTGGTVIVDHGQGLFTMYFHLSKRDVKAGDAVEKGQGIGAIGATGRVTGPHLHFAVRLHALYVDPKELLALDLSADAQDEEVPGPL